MRVRFAGSNACDTAEVKGAAWSRAPVIRSRTSYSRAAKSVLRIRTSWSKRFVRREPGLCFSGIGNNTRGRLQWKWLRQIYLVAWALPVVCEHRPSCRQTQSTKLGIPKRVKWVGRKWTGRTATEVLWSVLGSNRSLEGDGLQSPRESSTRQIAVEREASKPAGNPAARRRNEVSRRVRGCYETSLQTGLVRQID
jgi:hypothetical protein